MKVTEARAMSFENLVDNLYYAAGRSAEAEAVASVTQSRETRVAAERDHRQQEQTVKVLRAELLRRANAKGVV